MDRLKKIVSHGRMIEDIIANEAKSEKENSHIHDTSKFFEIKKENEAKKRSN